MTMRVLSFGACQLSAPVTSLVVRGKIRDCWLQSGLPTVSCYCLGDALQLVRMSRGQIEISEGLRFYCGYPLDRMEKAGSPRIDEADVAVLDCNTPLTMCVGDIFVNRSEFLANIYRPLAAKDPELGKTYDIWWHRGILGGNEEAKRAAAMEMIPALEGAVKYPETASNILLETRVVQQSEDELVASLRELRAELAMPLGMLTSVHQYFPDGRAISWPVGHLEMTRAAARLVNVPLLDTTAVVKQHGVPVAMNDSRTVYRPEFYPVIGDALLAFMEEASAGISSERVAAAALV